MDLLRPGNVVVAVIDVQERLLNAMPPEHRAAVEKNGVILVETAKALGVPIIVSEQYPKGLGPTVSSIADRLPSNPPPIEKLVFSCGRSPEFMAALDAIGRKDVILMGVETHVCVLQSAVDLINSGHRVYVPADAVTSRRELDWEKGLALMSTAGATVGTTETFVFQLLERAGTEQFKIISKLVK